MINEISKNSIGSRISENSVLEKKQRLLSLLRSKKAALGISDLFYFTKYILGYPDVIEQPHREMCDSLASGNLRILNLEPRGSFKTTLTVSYCIWRIIQDPNIRILIDSEELALSKKILGEIKGHLERNTEFINLYGDYVTKAEKWDQSEIVVNKRNKLGLKDPTINTGGVEVTRVGSHVDLLIEDDLHSQQNTQTPEQIEKVQEHWRLNQSILDPGGKEVINGTRWAVGDIYGTIIEQEKERRKIGKRKFHIRIKDAESSGPNNSLYFPTRLTAEVLADKKLEQGSYVYACQYKNNPVDEDAIIFKPHWFKFYGRFAPEELVITGTLDPAIGLKDANCYSNINIIGTDCDGYIYVLDNHRFRAEPHDIIDAIFQMCNKWDMYQFGIEVVAYQKVLKFWMYERMRQTGVFINIKELKTDTTINKDKRIRGLMPFVESGTIQFPGTGPFSLQGGILDLYTEMIEYPVGKYKDAIDSFAYQLQLYTPASIKVKKPEVKRTFSQVMMDERRKRVRVNKSGIPILGRRNIQPTRSAYETISVLTEVKR